MAPMIVQCRAASYRYREGDTALANINLDIEAGEWVVLAGASGSGKSTLCRLLNGLIPHLHEGELNGQVLVAGHDTQTTPPYVLSRDVGLLLQNPAVQCFGSTVARDIAFGPACQGLRRDEITTRVQKVAALTDVTSLLERSPQALSGGEQQRVALAGVLAMRPQLLVLDEPFAFLDAAAAEQLKQLLRKLHQQGVTIIVAEHRLQQLVADATRIIVLQEGSVVADAPPREVLAHDLEAWGLEEPPLVRLAREMKIQTIPLTLDEAAQLLIHLPEQAQAQPSADGRPVVEWNSIWFERNERAILQDANLVSKAGAITALLGANGAGKTTLLHHANGLLRPQRGTVRVQGQAIAKRPVAEIAKQVGLVVQHPERMFFAPTVQAEIEAGPRAIGRFDPDWCLKLIERWELGALLQRPPQRLSAGQQRRVALAAVMASRPQALLLDEPTAGQDAAGRKTLHGLIDECISIGTAVLLTTHDTEWAYHVATDWAVLADGYIIAHAEPYAIASQAAMLQHAHLQMPVVPALCSMYRNCRVWSCSR
jgi:energy-coupling factor transporter ATP-binding protein EcfA2